MVAAFVAGVDRTIPFHLLGDIPVPGAPWRRPTDGEIEQAVGAARRCRFRGLAVQKFLVLSPQICAGCLPRRIGPGYHAGWVGVTHLRRHHEQYHLGRGGHLYQARFKSFPVAEDESFLTLCRYVEANVLRAKAHPRPRCVPTLSRTPYPQSRAANTNRTFSKDASNACCQTSSAAACGSSAPSRSSSLSAYLLQPTELEKVRKVMQGARNEVRHHGAVCRLQPTGRLPPASAGGIHAIHHASSPNCEIAGNHATKRIWFLSRRPSARGRSVRTWEFTPDSPPKPFSSCPKQFPKAPTNGGGGWRRQGGCSHPVPADPLDSPHFPA
jgi:hypothetical protein